MEHVLIAAYEANQSEEDREIVTDEDENRNIKAAEGLKKLNEMKNFIEINGSDYLKMMFDESFENVEQMKLKNHYIRSFFRP